MKIELILEAVSAETGVSISDMTGPDRKGRVVGARQLVMEVASLYGFDVESIGAVLKKGAATVASGLKASSHLYAEDLAFAQCWYGVILRLREPDLEETERKALQGIAPVFIRLSRTIGHNRLLRILEMFEVPEGKVSSESNRERYWQ